MIKHILNDKILNKTIFSFQTNENDTDVDEKKELLKRRIARRLVMYEWDENGRGSYDKINDSFTPFDNKHAEFEKSCLQREKYLYFIDEKIN